ncbi:MAG: hypothetical protein ACFB6S_15970 [Geminicoccaceae bacterium]
MVKVVAVDAPVATEPRRLSFFEGQIHVPDDFDRMGQSEIEALFDGGE